ncbi:MAG: superoxide dismutase family protein [Sphingomicrobium sp.]
MNLTSRFAVVALLLAAAACSGQEQSQNAVPTQSDEEAGSAFPSGTAGTLISPAGNELGSVQASEGSGGVELAIDARGIQPGVHRLRIHEVGQCQGPNFESAGPMSDGARSLANVTISSDGLLQQTVTVSGTRLADLRDSDGSALVLHMNPDDPPTENSGDRIACAVL